MFHTILNKSWKQHTSCMATYLSSCILSKKSKEDVLNTDKDVRMNTSDVFLWTFTHGHTSVGWPAKTSSFISSVWYLEHLPSVMIDWNWWQVSWENLCCTPWWLLLLCRGAYSNPCWHQVFIGTFFYFSSCEWNWFYYLK